MKRNYIVSLLLLLSLAAMAQEPNKTTYLDRDRGCTVHDTFTVDPTYHYQYWWNWQNENDPQSCYLHISQHLLSSFVGNVNHAADYTKIVGVSICGITVGLNTDPYDPTFLQEYLEIYQVDSLGEKHLLGSTPWSPADTCYRYTYFHLFDWTTHTANEGDIDGCCFLNHDSVYLRSFESYFDKPVTVKGTYYVGTTTYSNCSLFTDLGAFHEHTLMVYDIHKYCTYGMLDCGETSLPQAVVRTDNSIPDTNWAIYNNLHFYCILPIIDTDYIPPLPPQDTTPCPTIDGLGVEWIDTNCVFASWSLGNTEGPYQVNYAETGMPFESGTYFECPNPYASICNLMTNKSYKLRVRSSCSTGMAVEGHGPWSDSLVFSHPPIGINDVEQSGIRIHPNPTRDRLTVERPTAVPATIEVFNAKGQKVLSTTTDQAAVTLDVSSLASGSYLLRVTTAEGSSVRSFVVGK